MRRSGCVLYPRRFIKPIAIVLLRDVFQVIRSTPGVRLPRFSVTRLMARSLPLSEWVSRCCKALTLFHLPSCVAFTIRAWSQLTFASTARQSISSHWSSVIVSSWETAPTVPFGPIEICIVSSIGLPGSLVMRHVRESARFRGGYLATRVDEPDARALSALLPGGIRFSLFFLPARAIVGLTAFLPA